MKRTSRIQTVISPLHRKKLDSLTARYGTMNEAIERGIELLEQMETEAAITESDEEILELKRKSELFDALSSFSGFVLVKNSTFDDLLDVLSSGQSFSDFLKKQQNWVLQDIEIQKIASNLSQSVKNTYEGMVEVVKQISNTFRTFHVLVSSDAEKKLLIQPNYFQKIPELVGVQLQGILEYLGFTFIWRVANDRIILEWSDKKEKYADLNVDARFGALKGLKGVLEQFAKEKSKPETEIFKELIEVAKKLDIPSWSPGFFTTGNRRYSYIPQLLLVSLFDHIASQPDANEILQAIGKEFLDIKTPLLNESIGEGDALITHLKLIQYTFTEIFGLGNVEVLDNTKLTISNAIINYSLLQEIMNGMLTPIGHIVLQTSLDESHNYCTYTISTAKVKILLVDDEKRVLVSLAKTLEREHRIEYEIVTAETGENALEIAHKTPIELVICDHKLPGMKGTDVLEKIRMVDPTIIRILITGFSEIEIARDAVNRARIHYFIEKPPNPDELKRIVYEEIMKKRQLK